MKMEHLIERLNRLNKRLGRLLLKGGGWDESKHPRHPAGSSAGGEFSSGEGGGGKEETLEEMMSRMEAENRAEEAARPAPTAEKVKEEAAFLRKWSKGKPIVRQSDSGTFWAAGKWMTKLDAKMVDALVAAGHATLKGKSNQKGATLKMLPAKK